MILQRVIFGVIVIAISAFRVGAQDKIYAVRVEAGTSYTINGSGDLRCYVDNKVAKKGSTVSARVYAQNNVRNIPMQLQYKNVGVPVRLLPPAKNSNEYMALRIPLRDILYTEPPTSNYNWIWKGRAKAPASPFVANEKVNTIKWWIVLTIDKKEYNSDTVTTYIKP